MKVNISISNRLYSKLEYVYKGSELVGKLICPIKTNQNSTVKVLEVSKDVAQKLRGNFFDMKNGLITMSPKEHPFQEGSPLWKAEGRVGIKGGKFLSLLGDEFFLYRDITVVGQAFSNSINGIEDAKLENYIVSKDIVSAYEMPTVKDEGLTGGLSSSCMRPESGYTCNENAFFYRYLNNNKNVVEILYDENDSPELLGRVLLWQNVEIYSMESNKLLFKGKYLDRPYGSVRFEAQVCEIARQEGWAYRGYEHEIPVCIPIEEGEVKMKLRDINIIVDTGLDYDTEVWKYRLDGFPYMDTLVYYDGKKLYSTSYPDVDNIYGVKQLQDCDGNGTYCRYGKIIVCEDCGEIGFKSLENPEICVSCAEETYKSCIICGYRDNKYNMRHAQTNDGENVYYCSTCRDNVVGTPRNRVRFPADYEFFKEDIGD